MAKSTKQRAQNRRNAAIAKALKKAITSEGIIADFAHLPWAGVKDFESLDEVRHFPEYRTWSSGAPYAAILSRAHMAIQSVRPLNPAHPPSIQTNTPRQVSSILDTLLTQLRNARVTELNVSNITYTQPSAETGDDRLSK